MVCCFVPWLECWWSFHGWKVVKNVNSLFTAALEVTIRVLQWRNISNFFPSALDGEPELFWSRGSLCPPGTSCWPCAFGIIALHYVVFYCTWQGPVSDWIVSPSMLYVFYARCFLRICNLSVYPWACVSWCCNFRNDPFFNCCVYIYVLTFL